MKTYICRSNLLRSRQEITEILVSAELVSNYLLLCERVGYKEVGLSYFFMGQMKPIGQVTNCLCCYDIEKY